MAEITQALRHITDEQSKQVSEQIEAIETWIKAYHYFYKLMLFSVVSIRNKVVNRNGCYLVSLVWPTKNDLPRLKLSNPHLCFFASNLFPHSQQPWRNSLEMTQPATDLPLGNKLQEIYILLSLLGLTSNMRLWVHIMIQRRIWCWVEVLIHSSTK